MKKKLNLELYKKLFLIRTAEEKIIEYYHEDEIKTPVHLSIGKEAIEAGICQALRDEDQLFGTYRSHGIYLARACQTDAFFAELYGKATGLLKGKGGSMHLCAPNFGLFGSSAIVGSIIPVAVGAAYANLMKNNGKLVAVFFGDGAMEEGVFWESLNIASLMKLPILFVCEDNGLAAFTPKIYRQGYNSIGKIVSQFNCTFIESDTTDAEEIYNLASCARSKIFEKQLPSFAHLRYYRYLEHVGVEEDFGAGYRSKEEFDEWRRKDPVDLQRKKLLNMGIKEDWLRKIEVGIEGQIDRSIKIAKDAAFPDSNELCEDVFYEKEKKN